MRLSYVLLLITYNGSLININLVLQIFHCFVFEAFCKVIHIWLTLNLVEREGTSFLNLCYTFTLPGSDSCSALNFILSIFRIKLIKYSHRNVLFLVSCSDKMWSF